MSEPFVGEIRMFAGSYAPEGWALCNGQIISIEQNQALFSLLGTTYGGDGRATFGLPNLQDRTPMHFGSGPGLTRRVMGEMGGQEQTSLQATELDTGGRTKTTLNVAQSTNLYIMQPYTCVNFAIAMVGMYPSRS